MQQIVGLLILAICSNDDCLANKVYRYDCPGLGTLCETSYVKSLFQTDKSHSRYTMIGQTVYANHRHPRLFTYKIDCNQAPSTKIDGKAAWVFVCKR